MTKDTLWEIYTRKNPSFLTDGATFTAAGLKKFFDTTWEQAHSQGVENGKALARMNPTKPSSTDPMDIFRGVFGKDSPL